MKKLVLPHKLYRDATRGRVTAGIPSLDPTKRVLTDIAGYKREWQEGVVKESYERQTRPIAGNGDRPRDSLEAQLGKPLSGHEVKRRLLKLNPNIIFRERPTLAAYAIYLPNTDKQRDEWAKEFYIGRMETGIMPEGEVVPGKMVRRIDPMSGGFYEEKVIDEDPKRLLSEWKRGWRTIINRLIAAGAITRTQADKAFGAPSFDNENWAIAMGDRQ